MPLAFKVDEDLPLEVADALRSAGHDAMTVFDHGLSGISDVGLWPIVQRELRCLVTADKGFANAREHPAGTHHGIVLLRLPQENREGYVRLTQALLDSGQINSLPGTVTAVSPDAIRIHRGDA